VLGVAVAVSVVLFLIGTYLVLPILRIGSDRKGHLGEEGQALGDWQGRFSAMIPVEIEIAPALGPAIAQRAVQDVGRDVERLSDSAVVAWRGPWGPFNHGQRLVAIVFGPTPTGTTRFVCYCQPRYRREALDLGLSRKTVRKLARRVTAIGSESH
jgi:hypothetical protein